MFDLQRLIHTVQCNCHISDARYAGQYSMCIFLLKMREYYRWEQDLPLSARIPARAVGDWLAQREQTWESLERRDFHPLPLDGGQVDPFDQARVNAQLVPQGYIYSSGYGMFRKPNFFLAELKHHETRDGFTIYVADEEYARDLVANPAMLRGRSIFVRRDAIRRHLWEKVEEWRWRGDPEAPMALALKAYGEGIDAEVLLDRMTEQETEFVIAHELGEGRAGTLLGPEWEQMLSALAGGRAEFVARAVRDHLADCLSTLPRLLEVAHPGALHFFFANFTGMRRALFPELLEAYQAWRTGGSTRALAETIEQGRSFWYQLAERLLEHHRLEGAAVAARLEALPEARPPLSSRLGH